MTNEAAAISPVEALRPFLRHTNRCAYDRFMAKNNRCTCGLVDAVARLNSTRSPVLSDEQAWQPIETAPRERDGYSLSDTFWAWHPDYGDPFPCKQRDGRFYDLDIVDRDGDWAEVEPAPTRWQPPPSIEALSRSPEAEN